MNACSSRRVLLALVASATLVSSVAVRADPVPDCTVRPVPTDSQDVTCTLAPSTTDRRARFVAEFVGSHDDTRLRLDATLDGRPLTCDPGSRTSLFAEDGVVQLDCRFGVPAAAATRILKVALTVHHAQYGSSSLDLE